MDANQADTLIGIYQEVLTEIGFLLTYRHAYFTDVSISWIDNRRQRSLSDLPPESLTPG